MKSLAPDVKPAGRYSVQRAAKELGVSRHYLYSRIRCGAITAKELSWETTPKGRRCRILGSCLLRIWHGEDTTGRPMYT